MDMAKHAKTKAEYQKEVEEIRRLQDLSRILKAGDVENALLSNSAKDSETLPDNVLDSMLERANVEERGGEKGLELIEKLTVGTGGYRVSKEKSIKVRKSKGKARVIRSVRATKSVPKRKGR